ncbi:hypothetical protein AOQ84DRAFT_410978 [Glonium stellatum]|uniref:Mur ligase N-terminal catalytic domain-containing protein n=1 Tax=Glonium stellatum TaxID=574774 RepID=A0A8E2EXF9_9PEZI|nr:hypothetical protein AOQ84DRAFT_410978 [Glonium stellatum]
MPSIPLSVSTIHFVGIGGNGMSGIALALHLLGHSVQGSDIREGSNVSRLRRAGITVFIGITVNTSVLHGWSSSRMQYQKTMLRSKWLGQGTFQSFIEQRCWRS